MNNINPSNFCLNSANNGSIKSQPGTYLGRKVTQQGSGSLCCHAITLVAVGMVFLGVGIGALAGSLLLANLATWKVGVAIGGGALLLCLSAWVFSVECNK